MVDSARTRAWCLPCALIALTIQGMTPDSQDLTSGSISRILRSIMGDGIPPSADEAPADDDATIEVCTPDSTVVRRIAHHPIDGPGPTHRTPPSSCPSPANRAHRPSPREASATARRLASLGRFTC